MYKLLLILGFLAIYTEVAEAGPCPSNSANCGGGGCSGCTGFCGCCKCNNCGSSNCDACPSCLKSANPPFVKQCAANMVLVLDESGSIGDYRAQVVDAARSFWTSLGTIINVGGTAHLGVIEFNSGARIASAGGQKTGPIMRSVTPAYIADLDSYMTSTASGDSGYNPGGCTDWGEALALVRTTPWFEEGMQSNPSPPDIVIFFTDGVPTVFPGECEKDCPATASFKAAGFGDVDDVAVACHEADQLKAQGVKIFLVGVGGVAGNDFKMESVTGTQKWDQRPSTFATADYIPDPDLDNLGSILYNVAVGLCPCLQQQSLCVDDQNDPNRACITSFSARIRVSSVGATASYPATGVTTAYLYYDFSAATTQRVAYQFFDPTGVPPAGEPLVTPPVRATAAPFPKYVRKDVHNPCEITREVECSSGCYVLSDKQYVPRFFHENGDILNPAQSPPNPTGGACNIVYQKPPTLQPEQVLFIWGSVVNNQFLLCAAMTNDGTLFEFLDGTVPGGTVGYGITPGLIERPTRHDSGTSTVTSPGGAAFNFESAGTCGSVLCRAPVEVVFVVDEQASVTPSDFSAYKSYIHGIVDQFDTQGLIRFGVVWSNNRNPEGGSGGAPLQFDNNHVSFQNKVAQRSIEGGSTDFEGAINYALDQAWPQPKTTSSPARHLVVLVGGPNNKRSSSPNWATIQAKQAARGVETWGIGVNSGANDIQFLDNFVSTNVYKHSATFPASNLLSFDAINMGSRLCPGDASLCDGCNGFCACPGQCSCPTCVNTPCGPRACLTPATGCVGDDTTCDDNNLCTMDQCTVNVALGDASCQYTPITCNDFNPCTVDACVPSIGCTYTPKTCNDNDICTTDSCNTMSPTGECQYVRDPNCVVAQACLPVNGVPACPPSADLCTTTLCVGFTMGTNPSALYCNSPELVAEGVTDACNAAVNGAAKKYCFTPPRKVCPDSTCAAGVCDAATGQCVAGAPRVCDDGNPCTIDSCDQTLGCVYTPRTCPRLDQCVNRVCSATPPNPNPNGVAYSCVDDTNPATATVSCMDNDPCTVDTCDPSSGCVYTPKICPVSSACDISNCDANTGTCNSTVLVTLLDFCGTCNGDNTACFFRDTSDLKSAAGLAGGIVAAIVIAAVIALALAIFFCKKGYDHYAAASAMNSGALSNNPTFVNQKTGGETNGVFN